MLNELVTIVDIAGIGDHQQLRPKLTNYSLTVASGRGIDADMSLFERLQRQEYPMATLRSQRRMQVDISAPIRKTVYPSLLVSHIRAHACAGLSIRSP
jgi:hypothetical protein